jgi:Poly(R)-hydroxyalkanoic acid synthase subunit (PHA_synth_III_E)
MEAQKTTVKTYYDQWLEQQTSYFQNWTKYGQDLQKNLSDSMPKQGTEAYKKWYEQQFEQYTKMLKGMGNMRPQMPSFSGMSMPGMPAMPNMPGMPTMPGMEQAQQYWKDMFETQQQWMQKSMGQTANPFQQMAGMRNDAMGSVFGLYDNWLQLNKHISGLVSQGGQDISKQLPNGVMAESVKNMFNSSEAYVKLLEMWVPMMKKMQQDAPKKFDDMKDMLQPERYKEVLDKVFQFASPEALNDFYTQASKIVEQVGGSNQVSMDRYQEMLAHNTKLLPELMAGDPHAAMKIYESMYEAYSKNLDPTVKTALNGRDAELMDVTKGVVAKVSEYVNRFTQFQYKIYVAGQKAMETSLEDQFKAYQKSGEVGNFNDFFKQWVSTNQSTYTEVFKSKEFGKLQNDLMDAGLEIKGEFQRLMEVYLADYPIVARSEMDNMYKKLQEVQSKLRKLEGGSEVAEDKAPAKPKTTTATAKKA